MLWQSYVSRVQNDSDTIRLETGRFRYPVEFRYERGARVRHKLGCVGTPNLGVGEPSRDLGVLIPIAIETYGSFVS